MIWQDIVISAASVILSFSLIPQVYHGFKEKCGPLKFQTSIPTFIGLSVITASYASLHLYFSTFFGGLTTLMWLILIIQRIQYKK